jgi:hypothetical protein
MSGEEAVQAADEIVRAAWIEEMLRCRTMMQDAVGWAQEYQQTAQVYLDSAVRSGVPASVMAARFTLIEATGAVRRNRAAAERLLPLIEQELLACASPRESGY